jgi:hypothetical protein
LRGKTERLGGHQYCVAKKRINHFIDKNTCEARMNSEKAREENQIPEFVTWYDEQHVFQTKYYTTLWSHYNAGNPAN